MKTKAAVFYKAHTPLAIEEVEMAPLKPQDVLVKVAASGVCHSDLHPYHGDRNWPVPMVMGHEGAGVVVEVGSGVSGVKAGDRVVISLPSSCGHCRGCATGKPCIALAHPFGMMYDGTSRLSRAGKAYYHFVSAATFADYAIIHYSNAIPVPDDIALQTACLVGCGVPTGIGSAVNTAKVERGSTVAVIGCGGVGLNVVQGCRLMGAARIIAIDRLENKLAAATIFGATDTVNASKTDPVKAVMEMTGGRGVDYAFEVIGKAETYRQAFDCIGSRGMAIIVGGVPPGTEITLRADQIYAGKGIRGSGYGNSIPARDFPWIFELYRNGQIKLDELITRTLPLEGATEALLAMDKGEVLRSVLIMDEKLATAKK